MLGAVSGVAILRRKRKQDHKGDGHASSYTSTGESVRRESERAVAHGCSAEAPGGLLAGEGTAGCLVALHSRRWPDQRRNCPWRRTPDGAIVADKRRPALSAPGQHAPHAPGSGGWLGLARP
jgi:hypothetical protein